MNLVDFKGVLPEGFSGKIVLRRPNRDEFFVNQQKIHAAKGDDAEKNVVALTKLMLDCAKDFVMEVDLTHEDGTEIKSYDSALDDPDARLRMLGIARDVMEGWPRIKKEVAPTT